MSVIAQWHGSLEHRPRSLLSRVRALVLASGLDHALANGASPEASVLLAVHAQRIVCPRACRALAATVRRLTTGPLPRSTVRSARLAFTPPQSICTPSQPASTPTGRSPPAAWPPYVCCSATDPALCTAPTATSVTDSSASSPT